MRLLKNQNFKRKKLVFQFFFAKVVEFLTSMPNLKDLEKSYGKTFCDEKCSTSPGLSFDMSSVQKQNSEN